jgi:hypothetical protein
VSSYARFSPLLAAVAVLAYAPAAEAMIQVDRGIAGARIGSTRAEVRAALGTPSKTKSGTNDFGPWVEYSFSGGVRVLFQGKTNVSSVTTTGLGDRTSKGVGVGSSEASVKAKVPGVKCENLGMVRSCHTGKFVAGKRITDFRMDGGKVSSVSVGLVID